MEEAKAAVARVVAHARARRGGGAGLARAIMAFYGSGKRSTVDAWVNGSSNPPAWVIFALARAEGISLDEFLMSEGDRRPLYERLAEVEGDIAALRVLVAQLLEPGEARSEGA